MALRRWARSTNDGGCRTRRGQAVLGAALGTAAALALTAGMSAQGQGAAAKPATAPAKSAPAPARATPSGVDTVIALLKSGLSESLVIRTLKAEGKTYVLKPADLLRLQKAGASEAVIVAMTESGGGSPGGPASPATPGERAAPEVAGATQYPPDLADAPTTRLRRLSVEPFDYSAVRNWVTYWFNNDTNIGEGIRAMLTVRLQQSKTITLLERTHLKKLTNEQDLNASNRFKKGSGSRIGQLVGADVMLLGDIVIFGRDDTTKRKGLGTILGRVSPLAAGVATLNKSEKAVVGINLRLVDTESGELIEAAEARGESSRTSKDYAGLLGGSGAAVGAGSSMTSSNFAETIIGEATSNAVTKVVEYLEGRVPKLPAKTREIEGRVASLTTGGAYVNVGQEHGVLRGDRFEVLKINGEIKDPVTGEVIDLDAVKVGELVVDNVRAQGATGPYGGQPLSSSYLSGKGYAVRLMTK